MIKLYSGTPGSGKSLHLARTIYWQLRMKHHVICNFPINLQIVEKWKQYFHYVPNDELTPMYLKQFSMAVFDDKPIKEDDIMLVIDESQMLFNARDWQKADRRGWLEFFTVHRHFGYSIILVAQFDQMLDKQVRSLIEYELVHRKVSNYGIRGWFLMAIMAAPSLFVYITVWYPMKKKVSSEFFRYSRKYGRLYDTFALFDGSKPFALDTVKSADGL